jgi:hypothetical protein
MSRRGPTHYQSFAEFEREVIRPGKKLGWSLDDLYAEATFSPAEDDALRSDSPQELDFDFN